MLWILQFAINLVLVVVAVQWLLSRKRVDRLESAIRNLMVERLKQVPESASEPTGSEPRVNALAPSQNLTLKTQNLAPVGAHSNLFEHRIENKAPVVMGASGRSQSLEKASELLAQGVAFDDVSRKTGLSLAELQLVSKVSKQK